MFPGIIRDVHCRSPASPHPHEVRVGFPPKELSADEKQELLEVIDNYRTGLLPLIVPVTLINHYVRKYDQTYLKDQYYLNPHPIELQLRNHV